MSYNDKIIAIDVGNTNITIALFDGEKLLDIYRLTTQSPRTSDEYGVMLREFVRNSSLDTSDIKDVIIGSVVPKIMYSLTSSINKYFNLDPIIVGPGIRTGIKIGAENPKEVGADLIVDAVAVKELYGLPAIVIDFGTATTYELVTADGTLSAVVICPGIRISTNALFSGTAKLPEIEIKKPKSILAKETVSCFQAGIVYGAIGQTEYVVRKMIEEAGLTDVKVVATGGLGKIVASETDVIDVYDPGLTMNGLRLIRNRHRGKA